jgi:deoxyguanosine kinase
MQKFFPVILSIGTNMGDKSKNIVDCIFEIDKKIGLVYKVSRLYESASWGFESDNFYNCAVLVQTQLSAEVVLQEIHEIEKKFGRVKNKLQGYEARIIDIDIVDYNHEIVAISNLQIPHKQLHNRKFVLLPIVDIDVHYFHPLLKQLVVDLLKECSDTSKCEPISLLETPLEQAFKKLKFIAIEGNIGAGKTSLAQKIAADFNGKVILEHFEDNEHLAKFYENPKENAVALEMSFLEDRLKQLKTELSKKNDSFFIADYHLYKSIIFAKINLQSNDFKLFKMKFDVVYNNDTTPNFTFFLHQTTTTLLKNITSRNRLFEQKIESDYLEKINQGYTDFINSQTEKKIEIIDISNKNFIENEADYIWVLNKITEIIK